MWIFFGSGYSLAENMDFSGSDFCCIPQLIIDGFVSVGTEVVDVVSDKAVVTR